MMIWRSWLWSAYRWGSGAKTTVQRSPMPTVNDTCLFHNRDNYQSMSKSKTRIDVYLAAWFFLLVLGLIGLHILHNLHSLYSFTSFTSFTSASSGQLSSIFISVDFEQTELDWLTFSNFSLRKQLFSVSMRWWLNWIGIRIEGYWHRWQATMCALESSHC